MNVSQASPLEMASSFHTLQGVSRSPKRFNTAEWEAHQIMTSSLTVPSYTSHFTKGSAELQRLRQRVRSFPKPHARSAHARSLTMSSLAITLEDEVIDKPLEPVSNYILVKMFAAMSRTAGGIVLPDEVCNMVVHAGLYHS